MSSKAPYAIKPDRDVRRGLRLIAELMEQCVDNGLEDSFPGITEKGQNYVTSAIAWMTQYVSDFEITDDVIDTKYDPWGGW